MTSTAARGFLGVAAQQPGSHAAPYFLTSGPVRLGLQPGVLLTPPAVPRPLSQAGGGMCSSRGCADPCPHHLHRPGRPRAQVCEDATSCPIAKSWREEQVAS